MAVQTEPAGLLPALNPEVTGTILIVDDEKVNRMILRSILEAQGHRVIEAEHGEQALKVVRENSIDAVILDVVMPGINGFSVCTLLKTDPATVSIPVLLLTSLSERTYRLRGMSEGANDYLIKPVDPEDVQLRVRNAMFNKQLYDQAREALARQRELEIQRDRMTHMLVHDLRSPLFSMGATLEMVEEDVGAMLDDDMRQFLRDARGSAHRMAEMLNSLLDVQRLQENQLIRESSSLELLAREAICMLTGLQQTRTVSVTCLGDAEFICDPSLIRRVIANLLSNAFKYSPPETPVEIRVLRTQAGVRLEVQDRGGGLSPEGAVKLFERYSKSRSITRGQHSAGLGLFFSRGVVEAHGGTIGVETSSTGSTFWFEIPRGGAGCTES